MTAERSVKSEGSRILLLKLCLFGVITTSFALLQGSAVANPYNLIPPERIRVETYRDRVTTYATLSHGCGGLEACHWCGEAFGFRLQKSARCGTLCGPIPPGKKVTFVAVAARNEGEGEYTNCYTWVKGEVHAGSCAPLDLAAWDATNGKNYFIQPGGEQESVCVRIRNEDSERKREFSLNFKIE
jgi:hypothetical protein